MANKSTQPTVNPFQTPDAEMGNQPPTDEAFQPWPVMVWSGAFFGLFATAIVISLEIEEIRWRPLLLTLERYGPRTVMALAGGLGFGILIDSFRQRKLLGLAPGHWLLIWTFADFAGWWCWDVVRLSLLEHLLRLNELSIWLYFRESVTGLLLLLVFVPLAVMSRESRDRNCLAWAMVIVGLASIAPVPMLLLHLHFWEASMEEAREHLISYGSMLWLVSVVGISIVELATSRHRAQKRDLFHWVGIATICVAALYMTGWITIHVLST